MLYASLNVLELATTKVVKLHQKEIVRKDFEFQVFPCTREKSN